jgi:hypothetical protein
MEVYKKTFRDFKLESTTNNKKKTGSTLIKDAMTKHTAAKWYNLRL